MSIPSIENIIKIDFIKYLDNKENPISLRTKQRYLSDINYYVEHYIINSNVINGLDKFFVTRDILSFLNKRKSSTARATVMNFISFLKEYGHLTSIKYLELTDYLKSLRPTIIEKQMQFFTDEQLSFLLNNRIFYSKKDSEEARTLLPLLLILSSQLIFEQDHLIKLNWSDVDLDKKRIRNLRKDSLAYEWINIDDALCQMLIEQRQKTNFITITTPVLTYKGERLDNSKINSLLSILKRKYNLNILKTSTDIQKINRSRILQDLNNSKGATTIEIIKITGLTKNTQLEHALEEYLLNEYSKMSSDI
ncbi:hypothetical protein [Paenibacillus antarcticus]|uniref:Uncharacterized protein n=1 Tax=Paenibacillus antarcticus TaxID=253703 RepID=A0A162K882_9BACL|nr:hypothetical protein [Paenibacillus antarcticus]OAB42098.1 hypothetical protein PBAT_20460 [Paenibacillus antarcticus]